VYLSGYDALAKLPDTFTSDDDEIEAAIAERTVDYVWTAPHRYQIENRLHLPPGHTPQSLPPPEIRKLGTMTLTTTHARAGDLYTVKVELDTGKRRITADELRATRAAVQRFGKLDRLHLVIARDAARLLADGQAAAAIAECQRLIALHPGEALHHSQLALTYLATGMGLAARRAATAGTKAEPGAADGWTILGHVLRHDETGRLNLPGADLVSAETALRKALALNPRHQGARLNLAELLAVDRTGVIAVDPARLREATDLRLAAKADGEADQDDVILTLLAFAGDAARLEELGPGMTGADSRRKAAVLSAALRGQSLEPALAGAPADVRSALTTFASGALMVNRAYDRARLVGRSLQLPALERGVQDRLRPIDPRRIDASDPAMATGALFAAYGERLAGDQPPVDRRGRSRSPARSLGRLGRGVDARPAGRVPPRPPRREPDDHRHRRRQARLAGRGHHHQRAPGLLRRQPPRPRGRGRHEPGRRRDRSRAGRGRGPPRPGVGPGASRPG
jgi:tetratricopeptide (TPR) repeat protein